MNYEELRKERKPNEDHSKMFKNGLSNNNKTRNNIKTYY